MNVLVVAAFEEDTAWAADLPGWEGWVIRKGVDVPNEGREAATFLHAMCALRDKPPRRVAFVQGNPFDHCPDLFTRLEHFGRGFRWLGDTNYLSDAHGRPHDGGVPVAELYEKWVRCPFPGEVRFAAGGQFMFPGWMLRGFTAREYAAMEDDAAMGRAPWAFERLWEALFTLSAPAAKIPAMPTDKDGAPKKRATARSSAKSAPKAASPRKPAAPKAAAPKPAPDPVKAHAAPKPAPTGVGEFVKWLRWGAAHEPEIHYAQNRPIPLHLDKGTLPLTTDCSGWVTLCAKWAGRTDPNGRGFDGEGYTGTLLQHCQHLAQPHLAEAGDLIVYGSGNGHHVVGIVEVRGHDFLVCSHGSEKGPHLLLNSVEAAAQPSPQTFLRFT